MHTKTALVTGGNTGLGFEVAQQLALHGATVIIACRSPEKAAQALQAIRDSAPNAEISAVQLNLGDLTSIGSAAEELSGLSKLDLLINNAGIMTPPFELTVDGFESQFGVNHLGPFAFTALLLDKLAFTPGARIINTSSLAGNSGKFLFDDINAKNGYNAMGRYCMSKLANLVFSNELDRRLRAVGAEAISVACHPGVANTELSRHLPSWFSLIEPLARFIFNTPLQGAWPTLQAATSSGVSGGEYYGPSRFRQTSGPARRVSHPPIVDERKLAKQLWDISEQMTGASYQFR